MGVHIVQKGETLWRIAKHYGIGLEELKGLNSHLANPDYIVPGMEIILPDSNPGTHGTQGTHKAPMTKEQRTAPMSTKERMTAPKEHLTRPVQPKEKIKPVKEAPKVKETAPIPPPVPAPMPIPIPQPMPMPQVELMPQFQFDFAPQMHFQQPEQHVPMPAPQPMPMPMPVPQPIFINVPAPQQQVETKVETNVEKEVEYVPVPQPQIIYVPVPHPIYHQPQPCPCPEKQCHHKPCGCHKKRHFKPSPCGCHEQQPIMMTHHEMMAQHEMMPHHEMMMPQHEQFMPQQLEGYQMMPPQYGCGCGGSGYPQEMMPYGMPYFEPNYDMAPMSDIAPAMDYDEESDGLPDWLLDSSEMKAKMKDEHYEQGVMPEAYEESAEQESVSDQGQVAGYNEEDYDYGNSGAYPYFQQPYGQSPMHYGMPESMQHGMPQHMNEQNCQGYPYMNPYPPHNKPWNY
ncbi:LysM peptidoglycan-binding domain-containing protein [Lysinibacillus yapensis]|uniref:LysM peptidoglycan-binding domain-containing protein n=1 Tax=Ureibacillus yapensis TaxID=2304605 RepID=A0A396SHW6_9BACL|nr:LysM peptidoglycan-binding domain-containing protein [Lysinibacillus yapensis]RHW38667.1 LysM peptidoglycan-binding domain-containing protein [Lysinibacillus yapensis]